MFRPMKVHHQEVSCRIQALWCNVMSTYTWPYVELSVCVTRWNRYTAMEAVMWFGDWANEAAFEKSVALSAVKEHCIVTNFDYF